MPLTNDQMKHILQKMKEIRAFELRAEKLLAETKIPGFAHLYVGEEAIATGVCECLRQDDYITSTHRGHGHCLAKGGDLKIMMAELWGRYDGYCKGKGGSMHIADPDLHILGANGIVGGGQTLSNGAALSAKLRGTDQVCVCFFGDGSTNQGTFHETLNMAAAWQLPNVFVCENNHWQITVPMSMHSHNKDVACRAQAYDMPAVQVDGNDPLAVAEVAEEAIARARRGEGPTLIECLTYRGTRGHFNGDPGPYRPEEEWEETVAKDPIPRFEKYLIENGVMTEEEIRAMDELVAREIEEACEFAENSPEPPLESIAQDVYTDIVEEVRDR